MTAPFLKAEGAASGLRSLFVQHGIAALNVAARRVYYSVVRLPVIDLFIEPFIRFTEPAECVRAIFPAEILF